MKRILFFAAALIMAGAWTGLALTPRNSFCPVMPGHQIKEKFYADYQGQRVFLCCRSCVKAFHKRPERYLKKLREQGIPSSRH